MKPNWKMMLLADNGKKNGDSRRYRDDYYSEPDYRERDYDRRDYDRRDYATGGHRRSDDERKTHRDDFRHVGREMREKYRPDYDEYYDDYDDYYTPDKREKRSVKGGESRAKSGEFTKEDAKRWVSKMQNSDGSSGGHWSMEQTEQIREQRGYKCEPSQFYAAMNMMYSDYYPVGKDYGVNTAEFYAALAHAFLDDKDGGDDKLTKYYECIIE